MNATDVQAMPSLIPFPCIGDSTLGYITVGEAQKNVPFEIRRVYWTYFTPNNVRRGGHAHKNLQQVVFAVCGVIKFYIESLGGEKKEYVLDSPHVGLYIPRLIWRDIQFSHNAVLLCLASDHYNEEDYIRHYDEFKSLIHEK
jgi:hypothetical protein